MEFRLAVLEDLPQIRAVYREIIRDMEQRALFIWDEVYPSAVFEEDIWNRRLYLRVEGTTVVSAFALCALNAGESSVTWEDSGAKALYLERLGVNPEYTGSGIGSFMLTKAKEVAKSLGAVYLRLFVVDCNRPAIQLYRKNGFVQADGCYENVIDADTSLQEYGYEIRL